MKKWLALLLIVLLAAGLWGCSSPKENDEKQGESTSTSEPEAPAVPEPEPEYPVTVNGYSVTAHPRRIVSLSPSITDKLADLGQWERVCGISEYCTNAGEGLDILPRCGSSQLPDLTAIYEAQANLVLSESELPREDLAALSDMGVEVVVLPRAQSVGQLLQTYKDISMLLDGNISGAMLSERFTSRFEARLDALSAEYQARAAELEAPKNALYLRLLDFTVATGETLESELLERVGLKNIAQDKTGWTYPEEEAVAEAGLAAFRSTDVIYMDEEYVTIRMLEQSGYYKSLQAVLKDWYLYIDCTPFERQSLAMLDELEAMAEYAYPK